MPTITLERPHGLGSPTPGGVGGASVITPAKFASSIATGNVVVEFFNYGCPFCKKAMPQVHKAASQLGGSAKVYMLPLNLEGAGALASEYGISNLPGFAVFQNGEYKGTFGRIGREHIDSDTILAKAKGYLGISE